MLEWLGRWVRTTFDYNPTFPLSAFLLLAGLKRLAQDGFLDFAQTGSTLAGISILQGYELSLLGVALLVLWPRRIAYETTAIFILFGLARFAAPFVAISFAVEGHPGEAVLLGLALAALSILKTEAIAWRALPAARGERLYDAALQVLACAGMPLIAHELAKGTGDVFSQHTARIIQLGACWGLAVVLAPLALRVPELGATAPLYVPGPTAIFHGWAARRTGLNLIGIPFLLASALWLGGNEPVLLHAFPLLLVVAGVVAALARAGGVAVPGWLVHAPAALAAIVTLTPLDALVGHYHFVSHPVAVIAFLPFAAAAVPLIGRREWRSGLRSLAAVAGVAPVALAPTWEGAELYALAVSAAFVVAGLVKKSDRLVAHGSVASILLAFHLAPVTAGAGGLGAPEAGLFAGALLATAVALRLRDSKLAAIVALVVSFGSIGLEAAGSRVETVGLVAGLAAAAAVGFLGWRQGRPAVVKAAAAGALVLFARRFAAEIDTGVGLVVLAFASIVAGTGVALRREARDRRRELAAREMAAAFEMPDPELELETVESAP